MNQNYVIIDGVKWFIGVNSSGRHPQPICPKHHLRLQWISSFPNQSFDDRYELRCEECKESYTLPRGYRRENQYILDKVDSKTFSSMKFINLDDEALPVAKGKTLKNSEYFVTSLLTKSKVGLRLVVYAGRIGSEKKTQIFVEPEIKRLAFDQANLHPTDIFAVVEATFEDGTKANMEKGGEE